MQNEFEFDDMRQQLQVLKNKLDKQEIVNGRLMRSSMKSKMSWIRKYLIIAIFHKHFEECVDHVRELLLAYLALILLLHIEYNGILYLVILDDINEEFRFLACFLNGGGVAVEVNAHIYAILLRFLYVAAEAYVLRHGLFLGYVASCGSYDSEFNAGSRHARPVNAVALRP